MSNWTATEIDMRMQEVMRARTRNQFAPDAIWQSFNPEQKSGFTVRRAANGVVFTYNGTDYVATNEIAATAIILNLIKQQLNPTYDPHLP